MNSTRRTILKAGMTAGAATFASVSGCLESPGDGDNDGRGDGDWSGVTAFFTLTDWGNAVGGDLVSFDDPVGTGRMGHGWEPDADVIPDIADSDLFLYLDADEFSWAQRAVDTLERDYGGDVETINALDGMEPFFIPFSGGTADEESLPSPEHDHEFETDELGFEDFEIWDLRGPDQLGYWHVDHWHGGVPDVPLDSFVPVGIVLRDREGRVVPLDEDGRYWIDARVPDGAPDIVDVETAGDHVEIHGLETGSTELVFEIYEAGELVYETDSEPSSFDVTEEEVDTEIFDPHLWVDPVLARRMVENVEEALVSLDPDNESTYRNNAADYVERLDAVDREFQAVVEDAALDTAVFAGHDSFRYIERRYDFTLETPVGVTADAAESQDDIIGLLDVIDREGIDVVLYDPFESPDPGDDDSYPQMVETILENSDAVEMALPLTPAEGTTAEWEDNDWGWVEQMEEINIPSLERALNPE